MKSRMLYQLINLLSYFVDLNESYDYKSATLIMFSLSSFNVNLLLHYKSMINFNFRNYLQHHILKFINTVRLCFLNLLHLV